MQLYIKTFYNTLVRQGSFSTPSAAYAGFKVDSKPKVENADIDKLETKKVKKRNDKQRKK